MDDDHQRRGKPTNHKVFGESTALLAGDALLTEAFFLLSTKYHREPDLGMKLIHLLAEAIGFSGMVGGQAIDLMSKEENLSLQDLELMHSLKTGALIRASVEGVALILGLPLEIQQKSREFGSLLGLAFQLKDDLLDGQENIERGSFPEVLGLEKTKELLLKTSEKATQVLQQMQIASGPLHEMLAMNLKREQ
jgi:geranylgeranyl diphosphate synthase type II